MWLFEIRNSYTKILQEILRGFIHGTYQQKIPRQIPYGFPGGETSVRDSMKIFT